MAGTTEDLTAKVRQSLSIRFIKTTVRNLRTEEVFSQSQSWEGYGYACESWHNACWRWFDQEALAELVEQLKGLQIDFSKWPESKLRELQCPEEEKKPWFVEKTRQEILQRWALFQMEMRGPEAQDWKTYSYFLDDMVVAKRIGANMYFKELAKRTQRKPAKAPGDRRLKYHFLLWWISGCLWALATEGVADFLNTHAPRSYKRPYHNKTISDARRDLKLYRLPRPLYWGLQGTPPRLEPLR
jgi:hypothetical protein